MSGFGAGANAFLNDGHKTHLFGANPETARGQGTVLNAHPKEPLIIYPAGKYIVVKNLTNPANTFVYRGHSHPTTVAKFSPNGFWVASADTSGKVRVWAWDNPEHLTKLETTVIGGAVYDLDWDNESKKIVAVGDGGSGMSAKCFSWDTGNSAGEMVGHNKKVISVAYKPTRPFKIFTASEDMRTCFYAGPPFKLDHSNNSSHSNFVNCVRYSPDGSVAVSVGSDKKIQFYDGNTGNPTAEIVDAHTGGVYSVAFSPDGTQIITASADKTVKQWNVASLACEATYTFSADPQLGDMQVSVLWTPTAMLSLSLNGNINMLNQANPAAPTSIISGHQASISSMYLDKSDGTLYTGSADGVMITRSLSSGVSAKIAGSDKRSLCVGAHSNKVTGIGRVGDSIFSVGWDDKLRVTKVGSNVCSSDVGLNGQPVALTIGLGGSVTAVITNKEVCLFRGCDRFSVFTPTYAAVSVAMFGDEEIAIGGDDFKTHIYNVSTPGAFNHIIDIETRSVVTALAYSPNGDIAIGDAGRQVEVYERGSWQCKVKSKWVFHTSKITALSWSPSGTFLASGSFDESIIIWNIAKHSAKLHMQFAHMSGVSGVDWVDEGTLVSSGNDNAVVMWKIPAEF